MTESVLVSTYHCIACDTTKRVTVPKEVHERRVALSTNGLAGYSDIHYCWDGILGVNNLQIDKNMAVRSFSTIEFPSVRKIREPRTGIPIPSTPKPVKNIYKIDHILDKYHKSMKLVVRDKGLNAELYVGYFLDGEVPDITIKSELGSVVLEFYNNEIKATFALKKWLQVMVDTIEKIPPTKLGLMIEALRFVQESREKRPTPFEIDQLYALLTTHKIKIKPIKIFSVSNLRGKYGDEFADKVWEMFKYLDKNKKREVILQEFMSVLDKDLRFITFSAFILELEGLIELIRPELDD